MMMSRQVEVQVMVQVTVEMIEASRHSILEGEGVRMLVSTKEGLIILQHPIVLTRRILIEFRVLALFRASSLVCVCVCARARARFLRLRVYVACDCVRVRVRACVSAHAHTRLLRAPDALLALNQYISHSTCKAA